MMTSGSREALKWLAMVLMTGDHVNTALAGYGIPWFYELGRIAMPVFAAVFAYGIASADVGRLRVTVRRLLVFGSISHVPYLFAFGLGWDTFNILFAFAVAAQSLVFLHDGKTPGVSFLKAALLLGIAGMFLEFLWLAPLVTLAWVWYWRMHQEGRADLPLLAIWVSLGMLCFINGNAWAFLAVPLVSFLRRREFAIPRSPWVFWVYYPLHLAALALIVNHEKFLLHFA